MMMVDPNCSSPIHCVLYHILRHLANPSEIVHPNARLVEDDARRLWTSQERCLCSWQLAKQPVGSQVSRKRVSRRYDAAHDMSNSTISTPSTDEDKSPVEVDNWTAQRMVSHWSSSSSLSSSEDDDDKYFVSKLRLA